MINKLRDPVSGLTHCIGAVLSVIGLIILIYKSIDPAKPVHLVTFSVFGGSLILLYTISTLYHWMPFSEKGVQRLRRMDHMMIFILIAATYTPICLISLKGVWGWSIFGSIWGLAFFGIFLKIFWLQAPRWFSTTVYVLMGWVAIVGVLPLIKALSLEGFLWVLIGGLFYTFGAVIYALKKPNPWPRYFGFHEIFHIFVMLGSLSHFWVMYAYVSKFN
ncbi:MAG: hemolysin III family protein [Deltaproteobacteria bacterium]|nr:hemolysin III family protein [Deltaproteobacteria bacterium]